MSRVNTFLHTVTPECLLSLLCGIFGSALLAGCNTVPALPPVDLEKGGWTVRQGQAVWKPGANAPELAGEVLLATQAPDRALVQFTKTPFPMIIAQTVGNVWETRIPVRNQRFSGRGHPPKRLLWLYLPKAITGEPLPAALSWTRHGDHWRLENTSRDEYIEGFFAQ